MAISINSFLKRGYIPLTLNRFAGIAFEGEYLSDFWMWNRQFTRYDGGVSLIQCVRVAELKEAALRYWRDRWVPLRPVDNAFLRRMEDALRAHRGLKREGAVFPDGPFLDAREPAPMEYMSPEMREFAGLPAGEKNRLRRADEPPKEVLDACRVARGGGRRNG